MRRSALQYHWSMSALSFARCSFSLPPAWSWIPRAILECAESGHIQQALWDRLKYDSPWRTKGQKASLNRFLSFVLHARGEIKQWHFRAFVYHWTVIESVMLSSSKFTNIFVGEPGAPGDCSSKGRARPDAAEKAVQGACQNIMALAAMFLSDLQNYETM